MPLLLSHADVVVKNMFISVNRCEVGGDGRHTAVQEVKSQFGISVHSLVDVSDIYEFLSQIPAYSSILLKMREHMDRYCVLD